MVFRSFYLSEHTLVPTYVADFLLYYKQARGLLWKERSL